MIKSLTVTNDLGESLTITLSEAVPAHGLLITDIDGLGPVKATINKTDLASDDGSIVNSTRIGNRTITLTLRFLETNVEDSRQLTYKYFPIKRQIRLLFETDNRYAYCDGYVESNEPDIFNKAETTKISIVCSDPNFYFTSTSSTVFSSVVSLFSFEFSSEIDDYGPDEFYLVSSKTGSVISVYGINVNYAISAGLTEIVVPSQIDGYNVKLVSKGEV